MNSFSNAKVAHKTCTPKLLINEEVVLIKKYDTNTYIVH